MRPRAARTSERARRASSWAGVAGCLFRTVGLCAHALHAHAGRWLVNEKGAVTAAGRLPAAPEGFSRRAHGLLATSVRVPRSSASVHLTYTAPVPVERAVHDMEHGAVWVTYRSDLPAEQVEALSAFVHAQSLIDESAATRVGGQANRYVVLSPWGGGDLPAPVVLSAWGHQLRLDDINDPRAQAFVDAFRASSRYTPELGAPVEGQPVDVGGRAAADGSTRADPATGGASSM